MDTARFNRDDLNRFGYRIEECLEHDACRRVLREYLVAVRRKDLQLALALWEKAQDDIRNSRRYDEEAYLDMIESIDDFNEAPLLSISEHDQKLWYVKMESARSLEKIKARFVQYLKQHHSI